MSQTMFSTEQNGPVMTVRLCQGEINIMTAAMVGELFSLVDQLAADLTTRVVVFESANPEFFIAHFDIDDILKSIEENPAVPEGKATEFNVLQTLGLALRNLPQVTLAKIDGRCRGGGFEFMLALDMCFATDASLFCFPEAAGGFLPAGGGSTLLPLQAGRNRALEIMLTCRDFTGTEAAQYNFINRAFATSAELDEYVATSVRQMAARGIPAIKAIKAVAKLTSGATTDGLLAGLAQENVSMVECLADPVVLERLKALAAAAGSRETELDLPATIAAL